MGTQQKQNHQYSINAEYLAIAENSHSAINAELLAPLALVDVVSDPQCVHGYRAVNIADYANLTNVVLNKGDSVILDMGAPYVGYVSFKFRAVGSPPDAPLHVKFTFGEMPVEVIEPFEQYKGWISSAWLQEESVHVDVLPGSLALPRRYSFRYLKIEILAVSKKFGVAIDEVICQSVTSAQDDNVPDFQCADALLNEIDKVSIKTLRNCMQDVFEDGPKRDRRLWLGDLRLQALANYATFKNYALVKRCLYLFAAALNDEGEVAANVFIKPQLIPDDTYLVDYSLIFVVTLYDYYQQTQDLDTLQQLWPIAFQQIQLALAKCDEHHIIQDKPTEWWAFFDWHQDLNKQASAQALLIYSVARAQLLATVVATDKSAFLLTAKQQLSAAAIAVLWRDDLQYFVSGENQQVSWSSQIWMVLAGVFDQEHGRELLKRLLNNVNAVPMVTPYIHHYLIEALLQVDEPELAADVIKRYWGGMIARGADTFWELYDPENENYSPYGSSLINSYCHAWSCTPTYFIRRYHLQ